MKKRSKKKFAGLLLVLCLVVSMFPASVFAAQENTISGSLTITSTTEDSSGNGWDWDASELTLTITDLAITASETDSSAGISLPFVENKTITIVLEGSNSISGFYNAINLNGWTSKSASTNIILQGSNGSLTVSNCTYVQNGAFCDVTINGTSFTSTTVYGWALAGIFTAKKGAHVDITDTGTSGVSPIYATVGVDISDSTVSTSNLNDAYASIVVTGDANISEATLSIVNSDVTMTTATGGWAAFCGLSSVNATAVTYIKDSRITINGSVGFHSKTSAELAGNVVIKTTQNIAIMRSPTITTTNLGDSADIQGYIRQGSSYTDFSYVTDYTLKTSWTIDSGYTLTIPEGVTLTLTDDAILSSLDNGAITNNGSIVVPCNSSGSVTSSSLSAGSNSVEKSHSYSEPAFTWKEDGSSCTAKFTCTSCSNTETLTATVTPSEKSAATCTAQGVTTYTASVTFNDTTYTDTKEITDIPVTNHNYEAVFIWSENSKTCTVTLTCTACGDVQTANATVTSKVKTAATATKQGVTTYTATVALDGMTYMDTKEVTDIPATGNASENSSNTNSTSVSNTSDTTSNSSGNTTSDSSSDTLAVSTLENSYSATSSEESTSQYQTGDTSQIILWFALLAASGIVVCAIAMYGVKRRYKR